MEFHALHKPVLGSLFQCKRTRGRFHIDIGDYAVRIFHTCYHVLDGLVEHTISVPRMLCHSCGHTHAVLSSCLIPYRSYSLRSILTLLRYYFLQQYTVQQLCEAYGIAVSTLYAWKQLFFHQKAVWLGVLTDLSLTSLTFLDQLDGLLLIEFFRKFAIPFLQQMNGTDRALLFAHGTAPPVIT